MTNNVFLPTTEAMHGRSRTIFFHIKPKRQEVTMGLRIRTNISSLNGQRNLSKSTRNLQSSMEKLSSGYRINKAADDSAGLAISDKLRADVRSLNMAKRNALDGVSMVQIAEGGLQETAGMLIRLRELSIQAASDTVGGTEREFLHKEFVELRDEIDRIAMTTDFNGTRLLGGSQDDGVLPDKLWENSNSNPLEIQVGKDWWAESDGADNVNNQSHIIKLEFSDLGATTKALGLSGGATGTDTDRAAQEEGNVRELSIDAGTGVGNKARAQASISLIDEAITSVNNKRAYLGSIQNRLGSTVRNLEVQSENLSASNSRIRDVDFAAETANMTQQNIMQQAGTSVLANANQQPQVALSLLG